MERKILRNIFPHFKGVSSLIVDKTTNKGPQHAARDSVPSNVPRQETLPPPLITTIKTSKLLHKYINLLLK